MGLGFRKYLDEAQQVEAISLLLASRNNFARIMEILEQATASVEDEEVRQQIEGLRQFATTLDYIFLTPSASRDKVLLEKAKEVVEATFKGPVPSVAPAQPLAPSDLLEDAADVWKDTLD